MTSWEIAGDGENAATYLVSGWANESEGPADAGHRWTTENTARLLMPKPDADAVDISLDCIPFLAAPDVVHQDVWVYANGLFVHFQRLMAAAVITAPLPALSLTGSTISVTLMLPGAAKPSEVSDSTDERALSVALRSASLNWAR